MNGAFARALATSTGTVAASTNIYIHPDTKTCLENPCIHEQNTDFDSSKHILHTSENAGVCARFFARGVASAAVVPASRSCCQHNRRIRHSGVSAVCLYLHLKTRIRNCTRHQCVYAHVCKYVYACYIFCVACINEFAVLVCVSSRAAHLGYLASAARPRAAQARREARGAFQACDSNHACKHLCDSDTDACQHTRDTYACTHLHTHIHRHMRHRRAHTTRMHTRTRTHTHTCMSGSILGLMSTFTSAHAHIGIIIE
jgi:hypothetical protein